VARTLKHSPSTSQAASQAQAQVDHNCPLCPRLVAFRNEARQKYPTWHNAPVPNFGPNSAELLIVGLAPGLRGANQTGRPFTGDWAGDLLYETLIEYGFASGVYEEHANDSLTLINTCVTNAVRCVPPENKPTPAEITTCRAFLSAHIAHMDNIKAIIALGRIAHDSLVRALGSTPSRLPFAHGSQHKIIYGDRTITLFDSYHCSRYNTNTGVLTPKMFKSVFNNVRKHFASGFKHPAQAPL
jgi:uracil-DNA glycosylase